MILTVALVAQSLCHVASSVTQGGGDRHYIYGQLQPLLPIPGVAVFGLKAFSICEVAGGGSGEKNFFFNEWGNQGIREKDEFHSALSQ